MTIYYIRIPEDQVEQHHLNNFLNFLESRYGTASFSAIAVVEDDPTLMPLLEGLANHVIEPPREIRKDEAEAEQDDAPVVEAVAVSGNGASHDGPVCEECGEPIDPKLYRSKRFCSKSCYMKAYFRKYSKKGAN